LELGIHQRRGFGDGQFRAHVAGEILVLRLPALGLGIEEDGAFEVGDKFGRRAMEQVGHEVQIHAAALVERDQQRFRRRADLRHGTLSLDGALAKDGGLGGAAGLGDRNAPMTAATADRGRRGRP
jgi:hypothetical protein